MTDCLFCRIVKKDIPAQIVYEDDKMLAFHDIAPKAPVHILLIPKQHIDSVMAAEQDNTLLMGEMLLKTAEIARKEGLEEGYRIVTNSGAGGGQEVPHLHFHILGDVRDSGFRGI